jgi:hypothetical protein
MAKRFFETNNGSKGGMLKGKAHYDSEGNSLGGIKAIVTDQGGTPVELEGNEVIINKKTVQSDKVLTVKGTPKEILSTLNQMEGNGVAIGDEEAEILAKYIQGGNISNMTPSELKAFYNTPEGKKLDAETYAEWKSLVNMSKSEITNFYNSPEGKQAGLSESEANKQGIDSGRESARWLMKMKDIPYKLWSSDMWRWAKKQISFIKRMSGMKGELYDDKGRKTRKHTALLIWGHKPTKKFEGGGGIQGVQSFSKWFIDWYKPISDEMNISFSLPNEIQPYKENNVVILDVFEKKNQSIDAKKYLQKIVDKADEFKVTIYLEPSPKHTYFLDNEEKKSKITKEYLINYYSKFGFVVNSDFYSMKRMPNSEKKFKGGGGIGDEVELELYQVRFDTDDDSEIKLVTMSYEDAKSEYEGATIGDFGDSEFSVSLEKKIDKYKFIYELDEEESIDDYPIEEYYDDSYYYELTEEGEFENIENRVVSAINSSSEDLLDEVQEWAKNKFGNYKYNTIDVYSEDDTNEENDSIGSIQLRIADHSQNESNLPYGIDRSLSVVIANKDATRGRFQQNRPQIYFSGDDSFDSVIDEIETYIEDAKEYIKTKKFKGGGELAKGTEHEMEHLATLKKVAERKLTPEQAVVETAKTHIKENPEYYEDLAKMEKENEDIVELYDFYTKGYENTAYQFGYVPDFNGAKSIEAYSLGSIDGRDKKTEKKSIDEFEKALKHETIEQESEESILETQVRGLELLVPMLEGDQKNIIEKQIRGLKLLINIV